MSHRFAGWLSSLHGKPSGNRRPHSFRPTVEGLETRIVPSSVPLHVAGNQLADPAGNAVVLRGVNVISLEWRPDGDNVLPAVNLAVNDWHANLLRLPVNQDFWFGHDQAWTGQDSGDGGEAYRELVDQVVGTARAANVYVMLDLHWSDMGVWGADNGQHFLPDDNSVAFWQDAAARYANDPAVLFDPYNEPHFANDQPTDADFALWRDGGDVSETGEFNGFYHSPGMQALIDTIRATGANNVVAPEGLNWGANLRGVRDGYGLTDPAGNLMYQAHLYPNKLADPDVADSVATLADSYPIYVGEWGSGGVVGQPNADAAQSNQDMIAYLDSHPNFSWTAWAFTPDLDGEYNLLAAWDADSATSDYGAYVKANLGAQANPPPAANAVDLVFAQGVDNQMYFQRLDAAGHAVGGYSLAAPGAVLTFSGGKTANGTPELFVRGQDQQIYALPFGANGNPIGGYFLTAAGQANSFSAGHDAAGNPELFAVGTDDQVYALKFDAAGNPVGDWFLTAGGQVQSLVLGHDSANDPELFVLGLDNQVYALHFDAAGDPVGDYFLAAWGQVQSFVVGHDAANDPELFAVGFDNQVYAVRFDAAGNPAGNYFLAAWGPVQALAVGNDANGDPELFVLGSDRQVYALHFDGWGNPAGGYFLVAGGPVQALAVGHAADGSPELFVLGTDNQIYALTLDADGNPTSGYFATANGQANAFGVTP